MRHPHMILIGQIAPDMVERTANTVIEIKETTPAPTELHVYINSWGGDMGSAFAIYNLLRAAGPKIFTYNLGDVSSAANLFFLAGDERYAAKHSLFKFHAMTWDFGAAGLHGTYRIEDVHSSIQAFQTLQKKLYRERTRITADEIEGFFHRPVNFDPTDAQARGIINGVRDPII